jgi:hypothetical protein
MTLDDHHDMLGVSGGRLLLLLTGIAATAFLFYGNSRPIWLDEAHYLAYANQEWSAMLAGLRNDSHPPLYFLLLSGWISFAGDSEFAIRSLSWALYVVTAGVIFKLGRCLFQDRNVAILASFLFLTSRTAVKQAQHAQMYALLACLVALSILFFVRTFFLASRRKPDLVLYGLFTLLGSFTHLWFFFVLLGQSLAFLFFCDRSRLKTYLLVTSLALLPYAILWLPILLQYQIHTGAVDWMAGEQFGPMTLLSTFAHYYGGGIRGVVAWTAFLAVVLVRPDRGLVGRWRLTSIGALREQLRAKQTLFLLTLLGVFLLTPLAISQLKPIYRVGSYTIIGLIPLSLLLGSALNRFGDRRLGLTLVYGLLFASVATFFVIRIGAEGNCTDRTAAQRLLEHGGDGDVVVFTSLSQPAIDYYLHRADLSRDLTRISFPADQVEHRGWRSIPRLMARQEQLEQEAAAVVRRLESAMERGGRVWLIYGRDLEISDLLKGRLDAAFSLVESFECPTPDTTGVPYHFYDVLLRYAPRQTTSGAAPEPAAVGDRPGAGTEGPILRASGEPARIRPGAGAGSRECAGGPAARHAAATPARSPRARRSARNSPRSRRPAAPLRSRQRQRCERRG